MAKKALGRIKEKHETLFTYTNDFLGTSFGCEHAENSSAATDIENGFPFKQVRIQHNSILVSFSPNFVLKHFFVNAEMSVGIKVIVLAGHVIVDL